MSKDKPGFLRRLLRGIGRALHVFTTLVRALVALLLVLLLVSLFGGGLAPLPDSALLRVAPPSATSRAAAFCTRSRQPRSAARGRSMRWPRRIGPRSRG